MNASAVIGAFYPGDAGWGDVLFVTIWAVGTILLAAFYCYRAFIAR